MQNTDFQVLDSWQSRTMLMERRETHEVSRVITATFLLEALAQFQNREGESKQCVAVPLS